jgi:hypothetical protein
MEQGNLETPGPSFTAVWGVGSLNIEALSIEYFLIPRMFNFQCSMHHFQFNLVS